MTAHITAGLLGPFAYGRGYPQLLRVPKPEAEENVEFTVPGSAHWLVVAARCKMKTSPAAGTRYMSLNLIDPDGETILEMPAGDGQAPSGTQPYNWARGLEYVAETPSVINVAPLPHLILPPAYKVQLVMVQGQLVDKLEAVTLLVETFPTGPTGYPTGVVGYGEPPQPS